MRLFIGVEIPQQIRRGIESMGETLAASWNIENRCFVRPENLHLTIKFIGEVAQQQVMKICDALQKGAFPSAFELSADRLVCLPERGAVGILAVGLTGDLDRLLHLHGVIESACAELDISREPRPFKPHITFARLRPPLAPIWRPKKGAISHLPRDATARFSITELVLFESHLEPQGARYVPLARFPLPGSAMAIGSE